MPQTEVLFHTALHQVVYYCNNTLILSWSEMSEVMSMSKIIRHYKKSAQLMPL